MSSTSQGHGKRPPEGFLLAQMRGSCVPTRCVKPSVGKNIFPDSLVKAPLILSIPRTQNAWENGKSHASVKSSVYLRVQCLAVSRQFAEQWRHGTPTPIIQQVCYRSCCLPLVLILVQIWKVYGPNDVTDRFRKYQWVSLISLARPRAFLNLLCPGSLSSVASVNQAEIVAGDGTARTVRAS